MKSSILNHPRSYELQDPSVFAARVKAKQLKLYERRSKNSEEIHTFKAKDDLSIDFSYGRSCNDIWLKVHAPHSGFIRAMEARKQTIKLIPDPRIFFVTSWSQLQSLKWFSKDWKGKKPMKIKKTTNFKYASCQRMDYIFVEAKKSLKNEKRILRWLKEFFDDIIVSQLIYEFLVKKRVKFILKTGVYGRYRAKSNMIRNKQMFITQGVSVIYQDEERLIGLDTLGYGASQTSRYSGGVFTFTVEYCDIFDELFQMLSKERIFLGSLRRTRNPFDIDSFCKTDEKYWVFKREKATSSWHITKGPR